MSNLARKITWRANLLKKAILSGKAANWPGVLKELFSSHKSNYVYPRASLIEKDGDFALYAVGDGKVWFPLSFDPSFLGFVYYEIFIQRVYEYGPCAVHPGDWVVDAGACEGFFSLYVLEKGANVLVFEPIPEIAQALERTLESYINQGKAKVFPLGLGREREEKTIILHPTNAGSNTMSEDFMRLHPEGFREGQTERVLIDTLDRIAADFSLPISFLKADVEGYERDLLLGAQETIRTYRPRLSICTYHLPDDWREIPRIVQSFGVKYHLRFSTFFDHMYGWWKIERKIEKETEIL